MMMLRIFLLAVLPALCLSSSCIRRLPLTDDALLIYSIEGEATLSVTGLIACQTGRSVDGRRATLEQQLLFQQQMGDLIKSATGLGGQLQILEITSQSDARVDVQAFVIALTLHKTAQGKILSVTSLKLTKTSSTELSTRFLVSVAWFDTLRLNDVDLTQQALWQATVRLSQTKAFLLVTYGPLMGLWRQDSNSEDLVFEPDRVACVPEYLTRSLSAYAPVLSFTTSDFSASDDFFALGSSNAYALAARTQLSTCDIHQSIEPNFVTVQGQMEFQNPPNSGINANNANQILSRCIANLVGTSNGNLVTKVVVQLNQVAPDRSVVVFTLKTSPANQAILADFTTKSQDPTAALVATVFGFHNVDVVSSSATATGTTIALQACLRGVTGTANQFRDAIADKISNIASNNVAIIPQPGLQCFNAAVTTTVAVLQTTLTSLVTPILARFVVRAKNTLGLAVLYRTDPHTLTWNTTELDGNYVAVYDTERLFETKQCSINNASTSAVVAITHNCIQQVHSLQFPPADLPGPLAVAHSMTLDGTVRGLFFDPANISYVGPEAHTDNSLRQDFQKCNLCNVFNSLRSASTRDACSDDPNFRDGNNQPCSFWASRTCSAASADPFNFDASQVSDLLRRCALSCRQCTPTTLATSVSGVCTNPNQLTCADCLNQILPRSTCANDACFDLNVGTGISLTYREFCLRKCSDEVNNMEACARPTTTTTQCGRGGQQQTDQCTLVIAQSGFLSNLAQGLVPMNLVWAADRLVLSLDIGATHEVFVSLGNASTVLRSINRRPTLQNVASVPIGDVSGVSKVESRDILQTFNSTTVTFRKFSDLSMIFVLSVSKPFAFGVDAPMIWLVEPQFNSTSQVVIPRTLFSAHPSFRVRVTVSRPSLLTPGNIQFEPANLFEIESFVETVAELEWSVSFAVKEGSLVAGQTVMKINGLEVSNTQQLDTTFVVDRINPEPVITFSTARSRPDQFNTGGCSIVTNNAVVQVLISYGERVEQQCFQRAYQDKVILTTTESNTLLQLSNEFVTSDPIIPCGGLVCDPFEHNNTCLLILATDCDECTIDLELVADSVRDLAGNSNPVSAPLRLCVDRIAPVVTARFTDLNGNAVNASSAPRDMFLIIDFDEPVFRFTSALIFCDSDCIVNNSLTALDDTGASYRVKIHFDVKRSGTIKVFSGAEDLAGNPNVGTEIAVSLAPLVSRLLPATFFPILSLDVVLMIAMVVVGFMVHKYSKEVELRQTTPIFSQFILLGLFCTALSNMTFGGAMLNPDQSKRDHLCEAASHLQIVGVSLFLGSLVTRNYRVWRLFDNKRLENIKLTVRDLVVMESVLMTVILLLLGGFSLAGGSRSVIKNPERDSFYICHFVGSGPLIALVIVLGLVYVAGAYMIFRILVKGWEGGFNESKAIAFAFYNIVFVLFVFLFVNSSLYTPNKYFGLLTFSQLWFITCPMIVLFGPPFYKLRARIVYKSKHGIPKAQFGSEIKRTDTHDISSGSSTGHNSMGMMTSGHTSLTTYSYK